MRRLFPAIGIAAVMTAAVAVAVLMIQMTTRPSQVKADEVKRERWEHARLITIIRDGKAEHHWMGPKESIKEKDLEKLAEKLELKGVEGNRITDVLDALSNEGWELKHHAITAAASAGGNGQLIASTTFEEASYIFRRAKK